MRKIFLFLFPAFSLFTGLASASAQMTCTSSNGSTENLSLVGSGTTATITLTGSTFTGNLTYSEAWTIELERLIGLPSEEVAISDAAGVNVFLADMSVLNGSTGSIQGYTGVTPALFYNCQ